MTETIYYFANNPKSQASTSEMVNSLTLTSSVGKMPAHMMMELAAHWTFLEESPPCLQVAVAVTRKFLIL